jgi:nucleoside-diphosphate-sugar epimerase
MKLLLTGATGFIGSRLALAEHARGTPMHALGQTNTDPERRRAQELQQAGIAIQQGSLQDPDFVRSIVGDCDIAIHLAAAQHEANVPEQYYFDVNVTGTRVLLEACRAAGVRRFVYGSTIGVYGDSDGAVLDENSPPRPLNHYGRSKLEAERLVLAAAAQLPTSIVRISETYGPGDFRLLKLFKAVDRGRFFIIGRGDNQRQAIHVSDLVRGLMLAATSEAAVGEIFVMAGNEVLSTRETVAQVAAALGRPPPKARFPMWPFWAAAILMEKTLTPLGIQPPLHRRRLDFFRKSFLFDTHKAQRKLGFKPAISFAEGAAETAAWYRLHKYL